MQFKDAPDIHRCSLPPRAPDMNTVEALFLAHGLVAILFLLTLPLHLRALLHPRRGPKSIWTLQGVFKGVLTGICIIALAIDGPGTTPRVNAPQWTLWTAWAASLTANLGLGVFLVFEQAYSPCAADSTMAYLLAAVALDTIQLTCPDGRAPFTKGSALRVTLGALRLVLLLWETFGKFTEANVEGVADCPEDRSNMLSRAFFAWINPYLSRGYRNILVGSDMPQLSEAQQPDVVRGQMIKTWDSRGKPESKRTLPLALFRCLKAPLFAAVLPRVVIIMCQYAQPLLIQYSIRYVTSESWDASLGYWLVVAAVVTYLGLATATGVYENRLNQLCIMTRGGLVTLIHEKVVISPSLSFDDGEAISLMSNDAASLDGVARIFHETWAQVVEVTIGLFLLSRQVGWIWPLPLVLILLCSRVSKYVAQHLGPRQKAWNIASQDRVGAVACMLSSMQVVKMLGLQAQMSNLVRSLRGSELAAAARVRWTNVYYNASANALGIFTPAFTLALYTIVAATKGEPLDAETAFTTMAVLTMVTHPANMVMTIVPRIVASLAGFERLQNFLLRPALSDQREARTDAERDAVEVRRLDIGVLKEVDLNLSTRSITVVTGPVGSGKTMLLRSLLGEVTPRSGTVHLSTKSIGYCAQKPWIPNGTIRSVVTGLTSIVDGDWYHKVLQVCCLVEDIEALPRGDETVVGSRGTNLSGGQRQRIALARALFARPKILLLDDTFSALDGTTEQRVIENLFGRKGVLSGLGTTVIVVANSPRLFELADKVVILGHGEVQEQGPWSSIKVKLDTIEKFSTSPHLSRLKQPAALGNRDQARDQAEKDLFRATGDLKIYSYYFALAGFFNILVLVATIAIYSFFITIPQYWLKVWTESEGRNEIFYLVVFLFLSFMSWSSTSVNMWVTILRVAPTSGSNMHERLLGIVAEAKLSFFAQTDTGSILNRFSQDMQLIDKQLPMALQTFLVQTFKLSMQIIVLFIAQKWLSISVPILAIIVYGVQKIYLRTSRQLRFLELESQAAVFSSFLETVEGLETMRAFSQIPSHTSRLLSNLSTSLRPEYLLFALQRWLNVVLDLVSAALAVGVISVAVVNRGTVSGGQVGVALNIMLVANSTLLKLVRSWTNLEVSLGAVARMRELEGSVDGEDVGSELEEVPVQWPAAGNVKLINVTASYGAGRHVLRDASLDIEAGQKIILSGRTGSGKSSILNTLLGLVNIDDGTILLDGIDIQSLSKQTLRERCFITVTQEPFILTSRSLRFNLDPNGEHSPQEVFSALEHTALGDHFRRPSTSDYRDDPEPRLGDLLDRPVSGFPVLSSGQTQLFSLARAVLKARASLSDCQRPVVLLDEITSSLDAETERRVHSIIDEQFAGRGLTVVMVAHRKMGSMTGWRVIKMDDGRVAEEELDRERSPGEDLNREEV